MPNLRSVIAQVHQKSRWIGSHRNFSSSPPPPPESYKEIIANPRPSGWVVTRSLGVVIGYCCASYYGGDMVAKYEEREIKFLREKAKRREKVSV